MNGANIFLATFLTASMLALAIYLVAWLILFVSSGSIFIWRGSNFIVGG